MFSKTEARRLRCESRLIDFVKAAWHTLEPGVKFQTGWAVDAIADHLQAVTDGHIRNLLINVPPGCSKSMLTSVFWPAWEWGPRGMKHHRFITASYSQELAIRDSVRHRDLHLSKFYQDNWPLGIKEDENSKMLWANGNGGWRKASSVGAALTGFRGDRIILDDPHSVKGGDSEVTREETLRWFSETLPTRRNKQAESALVVIMQRIHERDVSGLILANELGYEKLILPMEYESDRHCRTKSYWINPATKQREVFSDPRQSDGDLLWPERFPRDSVEELKDAFRSHGGSYAEAAQLQQRPAPRGGGMFKIDDFVIIDAPPAQDQIVECVRGWDLAASTTNRSAFTAGVKIAKLKDGRYCILHVARFRAGPHEVRTKMQSLAQTDGIRVWQSLPQDPGQAGKVQKADLAKYLDGYKVHFSLESGEKADRAQGFAAQVEAGNVCLVRAPWNEQFLTEAAMFPNGQYMDQIDGCSRAYGKLLQKKSGTVSTTNSAELIEYGAEEEN